MRAVVGEKMTGNGLKMPITIATTKQAASDVKRRFLGAVNLRTVEPMNSKWKRLWKPAHLHPAFNAKIAKKMTYFLPGQPFRKYRPIPGLFKRKLVCFRKLADRAAQCQCLFRNVTFNVALLHMRKCQKTSLSRYFVTTICQQNCCRILLIFRSS